MTDLVFVNTSKQVGDADHIKMLTNRDAAETCFEENDPEGGGRPSTTSLRIVNPSCGREKQSLTRSIAGCFGS